MRYCMAIVAAAALIVLPAPRAETEPSAACDPLPTELERAACRIEQLHYELDRAQAPTWRVDETLSPLDDSPRVVLSLRSTERMRGRFGPKEHAFLIIRCEQGRTVLYIHWGGHFMSDNDDRGRVDFRVDSRPAANIQMRVSTDNMALGVWDNRRATRISEYMLHGRQLYVRATPFRESPVEARFPIAGLDEVIQPLRTACTW